MRSALYLTLFVSLFSIVQSAPLKIGIVHGQDDLYDNSILPAGPNTYTDAHLAAIRTATAEAHRQITHMKNMFDTNHPDLDHHLRNAFGEKFDKVKIQETVEKLHSGMIDIGRTNVPVPAGSTTTATTLGNPNTSRVQFTANFHQMTPEAQAGTVLHEASHALAFTKDYFTPNPDHPGTYKTISSTDGRAAAANGGVKSGYVHQDLNHLKEHASEVMHKNADSFKVFGHTATNGLHTPLPPIRANHPANCKPGTKGCAIL